MFVPKRGTMYACASRADALASGVLVCPKQVAVSLLACQ